MQHSLCQHSPQPQSHDNPRRGFTLRWTTSLGLLGLAMIAHAADAPATAPVDPSPPAAVQTAGGPVWHLNAYLYGTAPQIRVKLNGETERLMQLVAESSKDITDTSAAIESRLKSDAINCKKSAPYLKAQADLKAAQQQHDTTSGAERMEAGSRANKLKTAIDKMETDAIVNDKELSDERTHLRELKPGLKRHQMALDKASGWRDELVSAIRNGFKLRAPITAASNGTLGIVTPKEITAEGVACDYEAAELVGEGKDKEGLMQYSMIPHRVHLLVTGVDIAEIKAGSPVALDRNFVVDHISRDDPKLGTLYVLKPAPANTDDLFAEIIPLRTDANK